MREAPARTSRAIARMRKYSVQTYQAVCLLFKNSDTELDILNDRVREVEKRVSRRRE
jgi:hypothetical protein